jgi:uncharacterized protein YjbI with pentapeptide repeats
MTPEAAARRIQSFEQRFGLPHLYLAYHAAFPVALTPDLLYRLWGTFQRDSQNRVLNIPWVAVSDLLLSNLCEEVGHELYEMDRAIRRELLKRLKANFKFGEPQLIKLANFLIDDIYDQLQSSDPDSRDLAQTQYWSALAYTKPAEAVSQLAVAFQQLGLEAPELDSSSKAELVRMASLIETLAEPLVEEDLKPLLNYARGMASFARGDEAAAATELEKIIDAGKVQIAGIDLPIPEAIRNHIEELRLPQGRNFSGQNLRGKSFRGQDLTRADFSHADIRSADFTNAVLVGANFSHAQAGLQRRWAAGLLLCALLLLILSSISIVLLSGLAGWAFFYARSLLPFNRPEMTYVGASLVGPVVFGLAGIVVVRKGMSTLQGAATLVLLGAFYFLLEVAVAWTIAGNQTSSESNMTSFMTAGASAVSSFALAWMVSRRDRRGVKVVCFAIAAAFTLGMAIAIAANSPNLAFLISLYGVPLEVFLVVLWLSSQVKTLAQTQAVAVGFAALLGTVAAVAVLVSPTFNSAGAWVGMLLITLIVTILVSPAIVLSGTWSFPGAAIGTLGLGVALVVLIALATLSSTNLAFTDWFNAAIFVELSITASALALALAVALAVVTALIWVESENRWIALVGTVAGAGIPIGSMTFLGLLLAARLKAILPDASRIDPSVTAGWVGVGLAVAIVTLGSHMGWRAIAEDEKFVSIRELAIAFAAKGATRFRGANLTDASFAQAYLKSADFTAANLACTEWFQAQNLTQAHFGGTFLQHPQLRQLMLTRVGQAQSFDGLDLSGLNLRRANLVDASFIGTNLKGANLRGADLSRAKLVYTQFDEADLTGACITGACIQNWQITPATHLRGVECDYLYTRLATPESPDPGRQPSNHQRIFRPGEFLNFLRRSDRTFERVK